MTRTALITATLLVALAGAPAMAAAPVVGPVKVEQAERAPALRYVQAKPISPAEAKRIALSRVRGGEVVDIRRTGDVYRVRVIGRDGKVRDIKVDARTGRIR